MADEIKSIDELRKAQAAAQAQGTSITNYNQWEQILEDLNTAGIESTGSFEGDVRLHSQIMSKIEAFIQEAQEAEKQKQINPNNNESSKVDNKTAQDRENVIKANVANGTSSVIMADYMKYYHLM
ncbi:MAG: hypothetical protein ACI37Q_07845 [Candidatus Gastranaerophilaceae bacterium]